MTDIVMTAYPRTRPAQLKFDKCKKGDVVWFTGGFTIAGNWQSFGRRAVVVDVQLSGPKGGVLLKPDNDPQTIYHVTHLITRQDIQDSLALRATQDEKDRLLEKLQLKPGDLVKPVDGSKQPSPSLVKLSKPELIARVRALESELAELKSKLAPA